MRRASALYIFGDIFKNQFIIVMFFALYT